MEHGILKMVVDHLPSPKDAQQKRLKVFCPFLAQPRIRPEFEPIKKAIVDCNQGSNSTEEEKNDVPMTFYVTKLYKMQNFNIRNFGCF